VDVVDNKGLRQRFWQEAFGDVDATVDRDIASDWIDHDAAPDQPPGNEGYKFLLHWLKSSFPDARFVIEDLVAEGDRVATRWTVQGTHTAPYRELAPTGRTISVSGIQIDRMVDGKVVESWNHSSSESIHTQLTRADDD
jgi:predicted ester cyclase